MVRFKKKIEGQVILIILLVTAVGLTLGLSLVSRAVSDVKISTQIAESQRAFSAAESGIETALNGATAQGGSGNISLPGASANYSVSALGGSSSQYLIPNVAPGNSQTIWFVEHQSDGLLYPTPTPEYKASSVDICWGPSSGTAAAMELTLFYLDSGTYKIAKAAFDPSGRSNNFSALPPPSANQPGCNLKEPYTASINFLSLFNVDPSTMTLLALRLNPVYNSTDIAVYPLQGASNNTLATQGKNISSTGTTTAGVARKLNVLQGFSSLPPAFDYTLFTNQ